MFKDFCREQDQFFHSYKLMPSETHQKLPGISKRYTAAATDDGLHQLAFHNSVQPGIISRIAQEQLNKSLKHAKATEVTISFLQIKSYIVLSISDYGVGFDTNQKLKRTGKSAVFL
jgi:signal transduction histidine kinase